MCRSIKTLREPYTEDPTPEDVTAAALQYVRKVSGYRLPAAKNAEAFQRAVDAVAEATSTLLEQLTVARAGAAPTARPPSGHRPRPAPTR